MEEKEVHETQPASPIPPDLEITPAFPTKIHPFPSHKSKKLSLLVIGFFILLLSAYSFQFLAERSQQRQIATITLSPSVANPTPDLHREPNGSAATTNWKTYTDENFTFKYPQGFVENDFTKSLQYSVKSLEKDIRFAEKDSKGNYRTFSFSIIKANIDDILKNDFEDSNFTQPIGDTGSVQHIKNTVTTSKSVLNALQIVKAYVSSTTDGTSINERYYVLIPMENKTIEFSIDRSEQALLDQILSTFKFLEPESTDPKTGWKIYTDEKSQFTFKYPPIFERESKLSYFYARTKKDSSNMLSVRVLPTSFATYSYKDLGGSTHTFDVNKKTWNDTSGFKKINTTFEAYTISFGDAGCSGDVIVIPHPDYSYVVEATVLHCTNIAADVVKPADVDLTTEEFLKTFTFLN